METKIIDVSSHNGVIDWPTVKAGGYSGVMIRAGWSWYEGGMNVDKMFTDNITGATKAGLNVGVYVYSYDHSPAAAKIAAARLLEVIKPYKLTLPVAFDMEYEDFNVQNTPAGNTDICLAFLSEIQKAGYYAMLYCSLDFIRTHLEDARLSGYDKWIAQYASKCGYNGSLGMWQNSVIGTVGTIKKDYWTYGQVTGVKGNCDVDIAYRDFPTIIAKLNKPSVPVEPEQPEQPDYENMYLDIKAKYDSLMAGLQALCNTK